MVKIWWSLDISIIHGVSGFIGSFLAACFYVDKDGNNEANIRVGPQLLALMICTLWTLFFTFIILIILIPCIFGMKMTSIYIEEGLDIRNQEVAYKDEQPGDFEVGINF